MNNGQLTKCQYMSIRQLSFIIDSFHCHLVLVYLTIDTLVSYTYVLRTVTFIYISVTIWHFDIFFKQSGNVGMCVHFSNGWQVFNVSCHDGFWLLVNAVQTIQWQLSMRQLSSIIDSFHCHLALAYLTIDTLVSSNHKCYLRRELTL